MCHKTIQKSIFQFSQFQFPLSTRDSLEIVTFIQVIVWAYHFAEVKIRVVWLYCGKLQDW